MSEQTLLGGTDGFRGTTDLDNPEMGYQNEVTHYWLTAALVSLQLEAGQLGPVVVARDTRPTGRRLAQASIQAARNQGAEVTYLDVAPTPVAQKVTELTGAIATIAVTASHNPATDNGWKGMLGSHKPNTLQVQQLSDRAWDMYSEGRGNTPSFPITPNYVDLSEHVHKRIYTNRLVSRVQEVFGEQPLQGKIVVYDGANGAGKHMVPDVLSSLGAEVRMINCGEGVINENCGAAQEGLQSLKQAILAQGLQTNPDFLGGIANDGDADRLMAVGVVNAKAGVELVEINGNHAMYELAQGERGIVGTIYTNSGLRQVLAREGIGFGECDNGDQHVTQMLKSRANDGWRRGGEFTGHLIDLDWLNSGDGVAMAAWLAAATVSQQSNFGDLYQRVPLWTEDMKKIKLPSSLKIASSDPRFDEAQQWAVDQMVGEGRAIVRKSGTEPVVRLWVESPNAAFPAMITSALHHKLQRELAVA